jgi:hypothetical protein
MDEDSSSAVNESMSSQINQGGGGGNAGTGCGKGSTISKEIKNFKKGRKMFFFLSANVRDQLPLIFSK